ncbi:MAG: low molecular weight protein arginine phosphatase, partial [Alicyclobacillus sp.]|nr:low molecular weight protein arginine phosphatase [Alicyclobacillus sp.]
GGVDLHLLFVCTGNTCRSPMAAFFARSLVQRKGLPWTVSSAGLHAFPGQPLSGGAARALARRGVPAEGHAAQTLTAEAVQAADWILTMTSSQATAILLEYPAAAGKVRVLGQYTLPPVGENRPDGPLSDAANASKQPDFTMPNPPQGQGLPDAGAETAAEPAPVTEIVDPYGGSDAEYEACAEQIERAVERVIELLERERKL